MLSIVIFIISVATAITAISFYTVAKKQQKYDASTRGYITDICYYPVGYNKYGASEEKINPNYSTNRQQHIAGLIYEYTVNGVQYSRSTSYLINENKAKSKIGQEQTIRYNSANPKESTITRGNTYGIIAKILSVVTILLIILSIIVYVIF